jgi:hypothetical protein
MFSRTNTLYSIIEFFHRREGGWEEIENFVVLRPLQATWAALVDTDSRKGRNYPTVAIIHLNHRNILNCIWK